MFEQFKHETLFINVSRERHKDIDKYRKEKYPEQRQLSIKISTFSMFVSFFLSLY